MTNIVENARHAEQILEYAERIGLPLPFISEATAHSLTFQVTKPEHVNDWARWMEVEAVTSVGERFVHHEAEGTALEQTLRVVASERLTQGAKP